jgi:hypothetical protein
MTRDMVKCAGMHISHALAAHEKPLLVVPFGDSYTQLVRAYSWHE